jgi:CheY-like chemotaxis protein
MRMPGVRTPPDGPRVVEVLRRAVALDPEAKQAPKVLIGFANEDVLDKVGDVVVQAGFEPVKVRTGQAALRRLNQAADIDAILIDSELPDPGLSPLLGQLRADVNFGRLPLILAAPRERETRVRTLAESYRNVTVIPIGTVLDAEVLGKSLQAAIGETGSPPLSEAERRQQADRALGWLARLGAGVVPGYDIRPAGGTLLSVLRAGKLSEEATVAAIEAVGRLPGRAPQIELANVVLDSAKPGRTPAVRTIAAQELARHIQQHGLGLPSNVARAVEELSRSEADAGLRAAATVVVGSMRPDARLTGERLRSFTPQPVPPEPPAKEPPKEPDPKEKEEKKDIP